MNIPWWIGPLLLMFLPPMMPIWRRGEYLGVDGPLLAAFWSSAITWVLVHWLGR